MTKEGSKGKNVIVEKRTKKDNVDKEKREKEKSYTLIGSPQKSLKQFIQLNSLIVPAFLNVGQNPFLFFIILPPSYPFELLEKPFF